MFYECLRNKKKYEYLLKRFIRLFLIINVSNESLLEKLVTCLSIKFAIPFFLLFTYRISFIKENQFKVTLLWINPKYMICFDENIRIIWAGHVTCTLI